MDTTRMAHLYPADLVRFISESWDADAGWDSLPGEAPLAHILSACYQASLMSEEQRPVAFRLLACSPQQLSPDDSPPTGMHRLIFFAFIGIEMMAEEIENPFSLDCNNLPTGTIALTIKSNVFEILEAEKGVEAPTELYQKIF